MSSVATRLSGQQIVGYVPHTSVSGDTWQLINRGQCTSAGTAGGATIVDTDNDSSGADAYNGRYYVRILSGTCKGELKRVVDDDGAGTLTLEGNGFSATIADNVEYEIWLSPEPVIVVDSSASATDVVDAVRTEADIDDAEFWTGYWVVPITGSRRGEKAQVTAFNPASGTYVVGTGFGGVLAAGDVCLLRKFIEASDVGPAPGQAYHPRPQSRTNFSRGDGTVGARSGTVGFSAPITPSDSLSASGTAAVRSVLSGLMEACGLDQSIGTSATIGAGSTTTSVKIATASWENFAIGQMVVDARGNAAFITAMTDGAGAEDTLTVTPPLPQAPASSETIYGTCMYKKSTDGDQYGVCIEIETDGIRRTFTGCKGNVTLSGDDLIMLAFEFQADHWIREYEAAPYSANTAYTSSAMAIASERVAYLDTTKTNINGFTATPGTTVARKPVQGSVGVNGGAGFHVTGYNCGATFRELQSPTGELDQQLRFTARTAKAVRVIYGSHGRTVAIALPVARLIELPNDEDADGLVVLPNVLEAQDAGTSTDGDSTVIKVPDWALHIA
jgi:hypothetical protein